MTNEGPLDLVCNFLVQKMLLEQSRGTCSLWGLC